MSGVLDIAAAIASKSLTLLVGSGLTTHLTKGKALGWNDLLVRCAERLADGAAVRDRYFTLDSRHAWIPKYDILIVAEMIDFEFQQRDLDLRVAVCDELARSVNPDTVDRARADKLKAFFSKHPDVNVITTNYDTVLTDHILPEARVFVEGGAISKLNTRGGVYHVHGCVTHPESLVLTVQDYYRFLRAETYFSRKLFTLLQESTVVIIGYSLGDINLNAILNDAKRTRQASYQRAQIFYVSRSDVAPDFRSFYLATYGIDVIEHYEVDALIDAVESQYPRAETQIRLYGDLKDALSGKRKYSDEFLKLSDAPDIILTQAAALGIHTVTREMSDLLRNLLGRKRAFTQTSGAWKQYEQLAEWLVALGARIDVAVAGIQDDYVQHVEYSFHNMSRSQIPGKSWSAYQVWRTGLPSLLPSNRRLVETVIRTRCQLTDAIHMNGSSA